MKTMWKMVVGLALGASLLTGAIPQLAHAQASDTTRGTQAAGPFQVTLVAAPKVGVVPFEVRVARNGKPVTNANVTLVLAMPYHRHGATISRLHSQTDLSPAFAQYVGSARLMEGIYDARILVRADGDHGSAVYRFAARKKPPVAHLGMWHPANGFEVRLSTDPESTTATEGENRFRVQVTREGYTVTDAVVSIHFTMPLMSKMGSAESYVKMTPQNGAYEGTAQLHSAGHWRAHITIKSDGKTGYATYDFPAR
jgi:hypothetical protein